MGRQSTERYYIFGSDSDDHLTRYRRKPLEIDPASTVEVETWDASNDSSPLEKYQSTIASEPDPDDPRLKIPHTWPRAKTPPDPRSEEEKNFVTLPNEQTTLVLSS
jgi:hypothetical protein